MAVKNLALVVIHPPIARLKAGASLNFFNKQQESQSGAWNDPDCTITRLQSVLLTISLKAIAFCTFQASIFPLKDVAWRNFLIQSGYELTKCLWKESKHARRPTYHAFKGCNLANVPVRQILVEGICLSKLRNEGKNGLELVSREIIGQFLKKSRARTVYFMRVTLLTSQPCRPWLNDDALKNCVIMRA